MEAADCFHGQSPSVKPLVPSAAGGGADDGPYGRTQEERCSCWQEQIQSFQCLIAAVWRFEPFIVIYIPTQREKPDGRGRVGSFTMFFLFRYGGGVVI